MRTGGRSGSRGAAAVAIALGLIATWPGAGEAQAARRGVQERQSRVVPRTDAQGEDAQGLVDRFAQRVGQALHLDRRTTARLLSELQLSRAERARIDAEGRVLRQELARVIEAVPPDEGRIAALLDELLQLEVDRARVALDEQARLAEFLTPLQRARVIWLQQRLARQALQRGTDRPIP